MSRKEISEQRSLRGGETLGAHEIQVWWVPLDLTPEVVLFLEGLLSPEEREQAARFHFSRDQRRFVVRRGVLRQLLAKVLATHPQKIRFEPGSNGKPAVPGPIKFNCSHSGEWALIAMSRDMELGVDLEQQRDLPDADDLAKMFFSEHENRELMALPPALRRTAFFTCWTRKEAFLKAIGLGLSFPLNAFSVSSAPDQPAALLGADHDSGVVEKWEMVSLDAVPEFSAALVHEAGTANVTCHRWSAKLMVD